ncbi:hypothetical protein SLA2020_111970 [Shorea laevis]
MASPSLSIALIIISVAVLLFSCKAELPRFVQGIKADRSLSFLVVGDWGRRGLYNQSHVAFQMGRIREKLEIDFII